jgi:hypothetical protein
VNRRDNTDHPSCKGEVTNEAYALHVHIKELANIKIKKRNL